MSSFMEKEIKEQPQILEGLFSTLTNENNILIDIPDKIDKVIFIASGSSYHCAKAASEMFSSLAEIDCFCEYSSEFPMKKVLTSKRNLLYVFLSQSGETSDTIAAIEKVKAQGHYTLTITNRKNSKLWNLSDYNIYCDAGVENSIASTKALSAQLLCTYLLMLKIMQKQGKNVKEHLDAIKNIPNVIQNIIKKDAKIKQASKLLAKFTNVVLLGSQIFYPIAKEASLKIKETSFINANAYPFGEFMHGHVAVLNNPSLVIAIVDSDNLSLQSKFLEKIKKDYSPKMITLNMDNLLNLSDISFEIKEQKRITQVFCALVISQLLALNCAKMLGRDIDKPHGLSKVVS